MAPNKSRICNMLQWERPSTLKMVQRWIGIINFFRRFLYDAAELMQPWMAIRDKKFKWDEQPGAEDALHKIYNALMSSGAFIMFPLPNLTMELATDASEHAIGAVLFQRTNTGEIRYLGFNSRKLKDAERRYSIPKKELIAILYNVRYYRDYLIGRPFKLHTDSQALATVFNSLNDPKRNSVLAGWMAELAEFSFSVHHIPGRLNTLPDMASRIQSIMVEDEATANAALQSVLDDTHKLGHWGANLMYRHIRYTLGLQFPNLLQQCQQYVKRCSACLMVNKYRIMYAPPRQPELWKPMQYVHLDLMEMPPSKRGYSYVCTGIDQMTGFVFLRPLLTKSMEEVSNTLFEWFTTFGFPGQFKSDQGREFCNKMVTQLLETNDTKQLQIVKDNHHANGLVERAIRTVRDTLEKFKRDVSFSNGHDKWEDLVPLVQFAINTRVPSDTHASPFVLMFGRHAFQYIGKHLRSLEDAQAAQLNFWETYHREIPEAVLQLRLQRHAKAKYAHKTGTFSVGDYVVSINTRAKSKSDDKYGSVYKVIEDLGYGHYRVQNKVETIDVPCNFLKIASKEAYEQMQSTTGTARSTTVYQDDLRDATYVAPNNDESATARASGSNGNSEQIELQSEPAPDNESLPDYAVAKPRSRRRRKVKARW